MRKLLMIAALAILPLTAQAQFTLGARVGYAPAMGDADGSVSMSDYVKSQIPLQLDLMYRVTPEVAVGGYLSYGFGQLPSDQADACDAAGLDCSATNLRLGVQATYAFTKVSPQFVPWLGAGLGLEWASQEVSFGGGSATQDVTGFEFLNLQVGGDYKVSDQFSVGPYFMMSLGQYSSVEGNDIPEKGMHEWLNFGLRGKFDL